MTDQTARGKLSPLLKQATGITAIRGEGVHIYDSDGKAYLDFTSGIGVTSTGHCHPKVVEAAQKQVATMIHAQYTTVLNPRLVELSEKLGEIMPSSINAFFFANAGTEVAEAALRLMRQSTGKPNIIVFHGGFHGRTMGSASMTTSGNAYRTGLQPLMGGVVVAPFPNTHHYGWDEDTTTDFCLKEFDRLLATYSSPKDTAGVLIEPVQGEGGFVPANSRFMKGLRERCDHHGFVLGVDEVQAGFGRSGKFWSHEHFGIEPDVVMSAKGLASGFPISTLGASQELMAKGWPGSQGGTYGGNAVAAAAALATIEVIREQKLVENAARMGEHVMKGLKSLQKDYPEMDDVRGLGLMVGVEMRDHNGKPDGERAGRIVKECEKRGLLMLRCGPYHEVVRWLPPLIVESKHIDEALSIFEEALKASAPA